MLRCFRNQSRKHAAIGRGLPCRGKENFLVPRSEFVVNPLKKLFLEFDGVGSFSGGVLERHLQDFALLFSFSQLFHHGLDEGQRAHRYQGNFRSVKVDSSC